VQALEFVKMEGLGNDYVFVDLTSGAPERDWPQVSRSVSSRHFGVGSDGLILIMPPSSGGDLRMRMFNADGSEGEMCGNGIRCFARYAYERGLVGSTAMEVETLAGIIRPEVLLEGGRVTGVRVDMGPPRLSRQDIPCRLEDTRAGLPCGVLEIQGESLEALAVSMGNPHAVILVPEVYRVPLEWLGPLIEVHEAFPAKANVEFVEVRDAGRIKVRVWERGSGVTLACGTGACASVVVTSALGKTSRVVQVELPGGELLVEWAQDNHVYMTGPANEVFQGVYTRSGEV
jgi:diaminopimelate epimerase